MKKQYDPKDFESRIYSLWEDGGHFEPKGEGEPFVVMIPPPNVTAALHLGHGLNVTLQDFMVRYHRMRGRKTLWVPGTDHAGIATQHIAEKKLREQGGDRVELGREAFVEHTWKIKKDHHAIITKQLRTMGISCDWSRERFTLDEGLSEAVREVFVSLYERGLLYRGLYLVNWCPGCETALADDEVEHQARKGKMYHILYPFADQKDPELLAQFAADQAARAQAEADGSELPPVGISQNEAGLIGIEVATTRPETLLGDSAVAVHPEDPRYASLVGKQLALPLTDKTIALIADSYVSRDFGTGAVKITPGHDPNDWEVGKRHNLEIISVLDERAKMNTRVPKKYQGLPVAEARTLVVADLEAAGVFLGAEKHDHQVGECYRCHTVVEPFVSNQWFVKMRDMATKAREAGDKGDVRFYPQRWINTYNHWMDSIRDWCISRQLWWGHRIPAWYCGSCEAVMVLRKDPEACTACGSTKIRQDEDVLDTWFSSWLWPFSTLGWPEKTQDLADFFPTSALVTGYDIIFFWVARMIMGSLEFTGQVPFRDVYLTGLIRDKQGRKMSKSLGNGIDPLEIVDTYGADAMKFSLIFLASQGQDLPVSMDTFKLGLKFANKVWNATRFALMNLEGIELRATTPADWHAHDRWIYNRLRETVQRVDESMANYRFDVAAQSVYQYFWNDFCDWYVEITKVPAVDEADEIRKASVLAALIEENMRLLHPFLPFLTEEIYQMLPFTDGVLMVKDYPAVSDERAFPREADLFEGLQALVRGLRTLRSLFTIPRERQLDVEIVIKGADKDFVALLKDYKGVMEKLMGARLSYVEAIADPSGKLPVAGLMVEMYVDVLDVIDIAAELAKLKTRIVKLEKTVKVSRGKLANDKFTSNAPEEVVATEREILAEAEDDLEKSKSYVELLCR